MIGQTLWTEFFSNRDWPVASAIAVVLLALLLVPIVIYQRLQMRASWRTPLMRADLAPSTSSRSRSASRFSICRSSILVIYSFNASRLVTVWGGWSLALVSRTAARRRHARRRLDQPAHRARSSASAATVLGTLAALALVRMGRFRGRLLFSGMVYAPLVMPEVITGLSLLLLFVARRCRPRLLDHRVAHTTLTMCFVTVIVQSRLIGFDRSLEEAAMDLGCPPLKTFLTITLPLIAPAIAAGWMLAFTLSLDDLVIASFTTGPGATTLPIRIYSEVRLGVKPEINAICTIMIAVVAIGNHRRLAADQARRRAARARGASRRARYEASRCCAGRAGGGQVDQEPDRHDHQRAEQDVRPAPSRSRCRA